MRKNKMIVNRDYLQPGECICVVRNKRTGEIRLVYGAVERVPYNKGASAETRKKYGENLVYAIFYYDEEILGYYQSRLNFGAKS